MKSSSNEYYDIIVCRTGSDNTITFFKIDTVSHNDSKISTMAKDIINEQGYYLNDVKLYYMTLHTIMVKSNSILSKEIPEFIRKRYMKEVRLNKINKIKNIE